MSTEQPPAEVIANEGDRQGLGSGSVSSTPDVSGDRPPRIVGMSINSFSGPIPPPEILERLERIVPGSAAKIINSAMKQSEHRRQLEAAVVLGNVRRADRGLIFGSVIALSLILLGFVTILMGHEPAGAALAISSIVGLVSVFVYGTRVRNRESLKKAETVMKIVEGRSESTSV